MENKKCKMCGYKKPISEFYLLRKGGKYRQSYCIPCSVLRAKPNRPIYNATKRRKPSGRANQLFLSARSRAKKKHLPFTLTPQRVLSALEKGTCEVTGLPFDMSTDHAGQKQPFAPSIDRKVLKSGYTDSNVQIVVWIHNMARSNWGNDALKKYIRSFIDKVS